MSLPRLLFVCVENSCRSQMAEGFALDWELPDPKTLTDDGFRGVRDDIERRVLELIEDAAS